MDLQPEAPRRVRSAVAPISLIALFALGCAGASAEPADPPAPAGRDAPADTVRISTTTDSARAAAAARDSAAAEARRDSVRAAERRDSLRAAERRAEEEARAERERREREAREAREREAAERRAAMARRDVPPADLPGSILPRERIVAYYGHANSTRMGILGELPPDQMLARLDEEVRAWERADPSTPVRPALHLITTMATGDPGADGKYRLRMPEAVIERVLGWAESRDALVFLDIQPGRSTVEAELPRLEKYLKLPHVHLALDPEWAMGPQGLPGKRIGSMGADDVNVAIQWLDQIVQENDLPPKVLVVHRFTSSMLRNVENIVDEPTVQLVINMDGWGPPSQKLNTYRQIVAPEIPEYAGFKLFYKNDRKGGSRLLTPTELLALNPVPFYIQYQ